MIAEHEWHPLNTPRGPPGFSRKRPLSVAAAGDCESPLLVSQIDTHKGCFANHAAPVAGVLPGHNWNNGYAIATFLGSRAK
jgi:hypothetical protein